MVRKAKPIRSPKIRITVTGIRSIDRRLKNFGKDAPKVIRTAASLGAIPVQQTAQALAPVATGTLQKSIKIRAQKASVLKKQGLGGFIGRVVTSGSGNNLFTGKTFYGGFQEMGWKTGSKNNDKGPFFIGADTAGPVAPGVSEATAQGSGGSWVMVRRDGYVRKDIPGLGFLSRARDAKEQTSRKIMIASIKRGIVRLTKNEEAKKFKKQIIAGEFP